MKKIAVESIKKIDNWIDHPEEHSFDNEGLFILKAKYIEILDIENCDCNITKLVKTSEKELDRMRKKEYSKHENRSS